MRNWMRCVGALVVVLTVTRPCRGASPEVAAVVERYAQSLAWESSATWDLKSHYELDKPISVREVSKQDDQISLARDGNRWAFDVTTTTFEEKRIPPTLAEKTDFIANGSQMIWNHRDRKTGKVDRIVFETQTGSSINGMTIPYIGCIQGYLTGFSGKKLDQILRDAPNVTLRAQSEKVDGHPCSVVDAVTSDGKISAWFADDADGGLVKLVITRDAASTVNGKPLAEQRLSAKDGDQLVGFALTLHSVQFRQISGKYIPSRATVDKITTFKDGRTESSARVYEQNNVHLNPDFSKLHCFDLNAPDGTPAIDLEHQNNGIIYVWKDGKVQVAAHKSDVVASPVTVPIQPNRGRAIYYCAICASLLFAAGVILGLRRIRRSRVRTKSGMERPR